MYYTISKKHILNFYFSTSLELMKQTTQLPEKEHFYSSLSEDTISDDSYAFAKKVWKTFKCKTLLDYTEIYCEIDTILLAEIFQKFRKDMIYFSGLDPARYISLPGFSFDSMLKLTKCHLELPTDINIVQFIESGIRGGLSFINTRHLKAVKPNEKLFYIDANNLYGLAQTCKLPTGNLQFIPEKRYSHINWTTVDTEGNIGYILEVDLLYPSNLHDLHSDFPLAPESLEVSYENLSPYSKQKYKECYSGSTNFKDTKLLNTFHPRLNYVLHFKNLKLYLSLGMKLKKIHRVLSFTQKRFIKPFIDICTDARQRSKTAFEQNQYKLVANSTYGKTIQNVRNYLNVKLHSNEKQILKATSNPTFKSFSILDEKLVQTNHFTPVILHDRPIFVGFTVLELSKHFMYDFYYNKLLKNAPCKIQLGFSDTDSFLFKVDAPNAFMKHIKPYMDFSNYPTSHPLYSIKNKSKLGYFKDELQGTLKCVEFIGLRAKCYALKLKHEGKITEKKVCKGLGKFAIKNRLKFKHYKKCLFEGQTRRFSFHSIRSKKHNISTVRLNKKALSHFDSKRWIFDCGIHSVPYGSYVIKKNYNVCNICK